MAERGATPKVSKTRQRALRAVRSLFSPLLPDDYLEMIDPLWSTRELRGRIERVEPETPEAATVLIRPGYEWEGHKPGQYLRIGVVVDGIHHWRAYSLTSDPGRADGCIGITPKLVEAGKVSPYLVRHARPGDLVRLGGVEGTFVLPDPLPEKLLFISAGSGITPIASMLRSLVRNDSVGDIVLVHSARTRESVIFGERMERFHAAKVGFDLKLRITSEQGRVAPADLDELCPDWRQRHAFASGPGEMLDDLTRHWELEGDPELLAMERFQPLIGGGAGGGEGGEISFAKSRVRAVCDGATPILAAGEDAGATLPYGCRMGICHTCVGELRSGQIRDLRTGEVHGSEGEMVRTCVNAPEGPIEIAL
jgi:stearoyl-CoA 9-desaturase NADPH oxidoreductase